MLHQLGGARPALFQIRPGRLQGHVKEDRTALLRYYYDLTRPPYDWQEFRDLFLLASAQRLMQALGAYGFLGRERGNPTFSRTSLPPWTA